MLRDVFVCYDLCEWDLLCFTELWDWAFIFGLLIACFSYIIEVCYSYWFWNLFLGPASLCMTENSRLRSQLKNIDLHRFAINAWSIRHHIYIFYCSNPFPNTKIKTLVSWLLTRRRLLDHFLISEVEGNILVGLEHACLGLLHQQQSIQTQALYPPCWSLDAWSSFARPKVFERELCNVRLLEISNHLWMPVQSHQGLKTY